MKYLRVFSPVDRPRRIALGMIVDRSFGKALPGRMVSLDLPDTSTPEGVAKAVTAIIAATAGGEITTGEASDLCGVLEAQRRAIELSDLEKRLAALEATQAGRA